MSVSTKRVVWASLVATIAGCGCGSVTAGTLDRLLQDKTLHIAIRDDAPPFSYKNSKGEPAGYMVDLCRAVAQNLSGQLKVGDLKIVYVPVTAADRFEAIEGGKADILCEPTSNTLSRRGHVDFSIATFVDGASLLVNGAGVSEFRALAGKKVGVLGGTTTEKSLRETLASSGVAADVVPTATHEEGLAMLDKEEIAAYFGDRAILAYLSTKSSAPEKLRLANNYLSIEPYALALPRGDGDFRLAVDRALSQIYRSGQIIPIFKSAFGPKIEPTDTLKALYLISALPE
jgi:ABC-type amino acid transport substrate-binding protein